MTAVDVDKLPPTQYLILELLAARYRLGETYWTFTDRVRPAADKLQNAGLIEVGSSPAPYAFQARFTEAGRLAWLSGDYVSPLAAPVERVRRLCEAAREDGQDLMRLSPSQVLAALDGRQS